MKWYLSAFHAGRKSAVAKKPYNPILGEIFQCHYDIGLSSDLAENQTRDGPVPWAPENNVSFIAEQTSHHPPGKKTRFDRSSDWISMNFSYIFLCGMSS